MGVVPIPLPTTLNIDLLIEEKHTRQTCSKIAKSTTFFNCQINLSINFTEASEQVLQVGLMRVLLSLLPY